MKKMFILYLVTILSSAALVQSHAALSDQINPTIYESSLRNGLKILIIPDTNVTVVSCNLFYFVGSMYEGPGQTGLSHMFEHMMFKGTKRLGTSSYEKEKPIIDSLDKLELQLASLRQREDNTDSLQAPVLARLDTLLNRQRAFIKKDEIWQTYAQNGGTSLNAWTAGDMTAYFVTLPKNKIELFCWIESDRMSNPILREFNSERDVVTEERRMRNDNRPLGTYYERLNALFYVAHPYRNPTIGWMSDIQSYTRAQLEAHVKKFYTPDNALLVLAGNVDTAKTLSLIRTYFEKIPRAKESVQEIPTREPAPVGQTRFSMTSEAEPRIDILFHTPGFPAQDLYTLDVLEGILSGRSGRLFKKLVIEDKLCTDAGAGNQVRLHNGEFQIWATLKNGVNPDTVIARISKEISLLIKTPPTHAEMERNVNSIKMAFVNKIASLEGLSSQLAGFERLGGWRAMLDYPQQIASVKADQVPSIATRYLDINKATIGILVNSKEGK